MKNQSGFTLIELMVTVALVGIVVAIGFPAMGDFLRNSRVTSSVNDFVAATTVARSEAMKRRAPVTVCTSTNSLAATPACDASGTASWENGWIVFADTDGDAVVDAGEQLLQRQAPLGNDLSVRTDAAVAKYVSFSGAGRTRSATAPGTVPGNFVFCDSRGIAASAGASSARGLNVSRTGRPQTLRQQADITALGITCP